MFYIFIFGIILTEYLLSLCRHPKVHINAYMVIMLVLSIILAFRYGQGSDYFSYKDIYESCLTFKDVLYNPLGIHGEIGFRLLCYCFRGNYERFIILVSFFEMWMLYKGINRFSKNKWLTLCIFYPTGYMSYYFSTLRQGITIAVFLGCMLGWIEDKKWNKYYATVILLSAVHRAALILLIIPLILKFSQKNILILMLILSLSGVLLCFPAVRELLISIPYIGSGLGYYLKSNGISILAMLERGIYLCFVLMLLFHIRKNRISKEITDMIKIYCFGVGIYFFFATNALVSSRLMVYFKILEIFIIPYLLSFRSRWRQMINLVCVSLMVVMLGKNINSYLAQGNYYPYVSTLKYPYVSIYNKEKLTNYRPVPY